MKRKILVVDDNPDILEITQIILQNAGYDVVLWSHVPSVGEILSLSPDLLLLDIRISGYDLDGIQICSELKKSDRGTSFPVILFSAEYDLGRLASRCGADGIIEKPFDITDFLEKVGKFLS